MPHEVYVGHYFRGTSGCMLVLAAYGRGQVFSSRSKVVETPTVVGFNLEESLGMVYDFTYAGAQQGLSLLEIQKVLAVEFAIQSGDLALPWSEDEVEEGLWNGGPHLQDVQNLMATQPDFTPVACGWAYHACPALFYMLHIYRTDGL